MEQTKRDQAEFLIKKILEKKSFESLSQEDKVLIIDQYTEDMKVVSKNYEEYLSLSQEQKLVNIIVASLKEYIGSWHVSTQEMKEISEYLQTISKIQ